MKVKGRDKRKDCGFLKRTLGNESGIVLAISLMVMGVMAVIGAAIITSSTTDVKIAGNVNRSMQALSVAEAGVSDAINYIRSDPSWAPDLNKNGSITDDATQWASQSTGTIQMGKVNGAYSIEVFDSTGTYGRSANSTRSDKYTSLGGGDVLVEVTGTVAGVTRKVGLVVRNQVTAFDYATYSYGGIEGNGTGSNPGKFTGKMYGKDSIQLQGNYDLTAANAESNGGTGTITPNCSSGKFASCNENATAVTPPTLDFSFYQNQANFATQQIYTMTPTVGSSSSCGGNCTKWPINYQMTTGGTTYTVTASVQAVKTGSTYNHTVYWCTDPNWNGVIGSCSGTQNTYTFSSKKVENSKPFMDAFQFNNYTTPTGVGYTSSVVNIFDAQGHLEFLGPSDPNQTATVTASILVGTASDNSTPSGKIDIEGGAGTLNFQPANGVAVVAEKVEFKAKYSDINVNVGTAANGAAIIATKKFEVEAEHSTTANFNMNGSLVVGSTANTENELEIGGNGTNASFTYTSINNLPQGWQNYGSMTIQRREWRELS